jgi:hypothetical protein
MTIPPRVMAVLRFSGRWSQAAFSIKSKELLDTVGKAGLVAKGSVFSMLYNATFTGEPAGVTVMVAFSTGGVPAKVTEILFDSPRLRSG